jgi:hypothetical protein
MSRRVALYVLVALVACGQGFAALELMHVPFFDRAPIGLLFGLESVVVVAAIIAAVRAPRESPELARWTIIGFASWAFWGALYYGAARVTNALAARTFHDAILERLPLVPAFTGIYLGVHLFSVVPYCAIAESRHLRRYLLGNVLIVALSAIVWVALPVRLDRPPFAADVPGFGAYLLRLVYIGDPVTNCFPSAHCSVAVYAALGLRFASRRMFVWGIASAIAICVSTVFTKQHYLADVGAGAALAVVMTYAVAIRSLRRTRD